MSKQTGRSGFSLAEVLLAFGLASVALLALVGQSTLLLSSNQKLDDTTVATDVAYSIVEQQASEIQFVPGPAFVENDSVDPFDYGAVTVGNTDYSFEVYLTDVSDVDTGAPVGSGTAGSHSTKLKKMEVVVNWWDDSQRQGMGNLQLRVTRLVKVSNG
jgi:Tfp pilus assembly protein PilV